MIVPPAAPGWTNPAISPDGKAVAFTDEFYQELQVMISGEDSPRKITRSDGIGKRFVFEPGREIRVVYRARLNAMPERPQRLLSTSIYLHDPVHRTKNTVGDIFGPYLFKDQVWYGYSLAEPLLNYDSLNYSGGPRWDWPNGKLWILNEEQDTVYTTPEGSRMAGAEISPDGQWIAAVQSEPKRELLIIRVSDGTVINAGDGFSPNWSGDAATVVFVTSSGDGFSQLITVRVPSGDRRVILNAHEFDPETPALDHSAARVVFASNGALYELTLAP